MRLQRYFPVLLLLAAAACSTKEQGGAMKAPAATTSPAAATSSPAEVPAVTFTAQDYSYTGPDTIVGGVIRIDLENKGPSAHHMTLVRIDPGHTFAELKAGLMHMKPTDAPPPWVHFVGGPNAAMPGGSSNATLDLQPGNYAILCLIPAADGQPHFMKGMIRALTVSAPTGPVATLPAGDDTIQLVDFGFVPAHPLTAGHHVLSVVNSGKQWHEMLIVKLNPGKTAVDFANWAEGGLKGTPPGSLLGGISGMEVGDKENVDVDFAPGSYALICFMPDVKDGKPHYEHGMTYPFTIT
jgi:hypothetical protein